MEPYCPYSSNSGSSSSNSYNSYPFTSSTDQFSSPYPQEMKRAKSPPAYRSALHSVRKFPGKNIIAKKPIAPPPPAPPNIYRVDPKDFKHVVQKLTGAPEFLPTRLREVAPPPLNLSPPHRPTFFCPDPVVKKPILSGNSCDEEDKPWKSQFDTAHGALSPLGFNLSPASITWCSSNVMSPGTTASMEPSAVNLTFY